MESDRVGRVRRWRGRTLATRVRGRLGAALVAALVAVGQQLPVGAHGWAGTAQAVLGGPSVGAAQAAPPAQQAPPAAPAALPALIPRDILFAVPERRSPQ